MKPAIVALTPGGVALARRIAPAIGGDVHARHPVKAEHAFCETAPHLRALFADGRPVVGICAAGILIRALAPLLADKQAEPPVVAVSEDGASVVPLLGGHRGANDLACRIATQLGAHAAVTTAGDLTLGVALDVPPPGWTLANPADAPAVMAALIAGAPARLDGEADWLQASAIRFEASADIRIVSTVRCTAGDQHVLVYRPRRLALGLGCERGADPGEVQKLVEATLEAAGLAPDSIACVASLDLKTDEPAALEAARRLHVPARFFDASRLEAETPRLANPSTAVFREVGCHGVAEAAALAAVGEAGRLLVAKQRSARATCAIAEAPAPFDPLSVGRGRGRLAIVGLGPGAGEWLTPEARGLLQSSDALVGYSVYLDLAATFAPAAERFAFALGQEAERARAALRLAGEGRNVALVSSGDPGIYAMASLAFQCLEEDDTPDAARRAEIVVAPGVSAMQAAAARAGAPLGHDFCAISLSDLLTPWTAIEARICAAAEADFVVAFYNPASQRRRKQLARAKAILLAHRPAETPVVVARNLGRAGESVATTTLAEFDADGIDMLTLVLVGASTSRSVQAGGRAWVYTPRGYDSSRRP
jgi:cobalt-precorrin 5A hydrolase / precorrin-3B C17-methyltransferase